MISIWPSEPNNSILEHTIKLRQGKMLRDVDWLKVLDWGTQVLDWIHSKGVIGGRGWTEIFGMWITVEIYSLETQRQ